MTAWEYVKEHVWWFVGFGVAIVVLIVIIVVVVVVLQGSMGSEPLFPTDFPEDGVNYYIQNVETGDFLNSDPRATCLQSPQYPGPAGIWQVELLDDATHIYRLKSMYTDPNLLTTSVYLTYLPAGMGSITGQNTNIAMNPPVAASNWVLSNLGEGKFQLRNSLAGNSNALNTVAGVTTVNAPNKVATVTIASGQPNPAVTSQQWFFTFAPAIIPVPSANSFPISGFTYAIMSIRGLKGWVVNADPSNVNASSSMVSVTRQASLAISKGIWTITGGPNTGWSFTAGSILNPGTGLWLSSTNNEPPTCQPTPVHTSFNFYLVSTIPELVPVEMNFTGLGVFVGTFRIKSSDPPSTSPWLCLANAPPVRVGSPPLDIPHVLNALNNGRDESLYAIYSANV